MSAERDSAIERVVLVGYMASGKSAVGAALARRLDWEFLDFDVAIEERTGRRIGTLVEEEGEERLRELEAQLTERAAEARQLVLAPGGGWITRPELLDRLGDASLAVWLHASPRETVRRLEADGVERPLRGDPQALEKVTAMMQERQPLYARADLRVPTERRGVEEIAFEVEQLVRGRRGR